MSYQATMGRRPTFGTYHHMSNPNACIKNFNLNNPYTLNSWGVGREPKSVAPSIYSAAKGRTMHQQKSFSILLTTAAFILLLAIITVAALAYYISSIKMQMDDSMLGFEGSFQISKGDAFSTGLKYNHTTIFKQKVEFYKRFLERALTDNGLVPVLIEILGFGDGPLIKVSFRTILDVRKWPQSDLGVEDFIKECIFLETMAEKSLYRYLRVPQELIIVKRILNDSYKSALEKTDPKNSMQFDKRVKKVNKLAKPESTTRKYTRTTIASNIDPEDYNAEIENAPVVHGSFEGFFEVTKTDADITQTKTTPTKPYTSLAPKVVSPYFLRVRPKKPAIEKINSKPNGEQTVNVVQPEIQIETTTPTAKTTTIKKDIIKTAALTTVTTTSTTTTTRTTTTTAGTTIPTTTTLKPTTTSTTTTTTVKPTTTPKIKVTSKVPNLTSPNLQIFSNHAAQFPLLTSIKPQVQTFTSVPILDTQPWRPIQREELLPGPPPAYPTKTIYLTQRPPVTETHFNLFTKSKNSINNPVYTYNTFGNMSYQNIERLGAGARIKPHPLPVSLIDDVVPVFKTVNYKPMETPNIYLTTVSDVELTTQPPQLPQQQEQQQQQANIINAYEITAKGNVNAQNITAINENEYEIRKATTTTTSTSTTTTAAPKVITTIASSTEKPIIFWNMKEIVLKRNEMMNATTTKITTTTTRPTNINIINTKRNETKPIITLDDSYLFPSHSKWEFVNSSASNNPLSGTSNLRKVFNKTLQAWVSEDIKENSENLTLNEIRNRINNVTNLQDISLIFDTLASKLGVTPTIPAKRPPLSENRLKEAQQYIKSTLFNKQPIEMVVNTTLSSLNDFPPRQQTQTMLKEDFQTVDLLNSSSAEGVGAAIPVFGEADVEEMDPTKYEELLRSTNFAETSSRETLPELVTLLPARSNLAIRSKQI